MVLYAAYTELAPDTATVAHTVCLFTVIVTIEMKKKKITYSIGHLTKGH